MWVERDFQRIPIDDDLEKLLTSHCAWFVERFGEPKADLLPAHGVGVEESTMLERREVKRWLRSHPLIEIRK